MRRSWAKRKSTRLPWTGWLTRGSGRSWSRQSWRKRISRSLRVAAGELGAGVVAAERSGELVGSVVAGVGSCQGIEGGIVGQLADLRLVEQVLEPAWGDGGGHVQDRSRRRRDPDGVVGRRLRRDARAVDADAGAAASGAPGGDVDDARLAALQPHSAAADAW